MRAESFDQIQKHHNQLRGKVLHIESCLQSDFDEEDFSQDGLMIENLDPEYQIQEIKRLETPAFSTKTKKKK